jgi:hypothetical protein
MSRQEYRFVPKRPFALLCPRMRSIPAFSKEIADLPTVSNDEGQRSGFLDHVKVTKADAGKPIKHMAAFYPTASTLERTSAGGNPAHPEFKNRSDDGMGEFPAAFSKKNISGTPKRTPGH